MTEKCKEGRHDRCKPWGQPEDLWCDCPCHEDWD